MGRKKGSGKAKTAGRKNSQDIKQNDKKDAKMKDDPGGGGRGGGNGGVKPAMEVANHRGEGRATAVSQRQQQYLSTALGATNGGEGGEHGGQGQPKVAGAANSTSSAIGPSNHTTNSNSLVVNVPSVAPTSSTAANLKYLHKKFKRIASATLAEEEDQHQQQQQQQQQQLGDAAIASAARQAVSVVVPTCVASSGAALVEPNTAEVNVAAVGDESTQIVPVRTSAGAVGVGGADRELALAPALAPASAASAGRPEVAVIGLATAAFDYQQPPQPQQYHQLHPSLHPGVAAVASFPPQSLLVHPHHQLLYSQHPPGPQQPTSANSANSANSASSGHHSGSGNSSSTHGAAQSQLAVGDNCDRGVAPAAAALANHKLDSSVAAVQYTVSYIAPPQHHPGPLLYTNGGPLILAGQHPALSSSSGASSGSPSPPTAAGSNLPLAGHNGGTNTSNSAAATIISANQAAASAVTGTPPGRYVCPYCQMNCSKPSVLEKHIRRHTNERPFKCDLCGIAFKTKSNLYKHRRSRAHASKCQGEDPSGLLDDDGGSLGGSDIDDKELSNSGSEIMNYRGSPMDDRVNSPQQMLVEKPYKPKFHNAAMYTRVDNKPHLGLIGGGSSTVPQQVASSSGVTPTVPHYLNGQNVESLEQHISKLISQNEAIVDVVEAPLQKKYHKITGISRGISVSGTNTAGTTSGHVPVPANSGNNGSSVNILTQQATPGQDSASSRLANALLQKRQAEEMQHLLQTQQQQQQQQQQQHYISYVQHQAQQNVINLTSKPVVTPKTLVVVQQQQLLQVPGTMVAIGGIPPAVGSQHQPPHQQANGPESSALDNSSSGIGDGVSSYQPLNLTKAPPTELVIQPSPRTQLPSSTVPSSLLVAIPAPTPPEDASDALQQQHPLPPYRKRTREQSPVVVVSTSIPSGTVVSLTTVCSTSTTLATVCSVSSQPPHVPLHIQVPVAQATPSERPHRPTPTPTPPLTVANHPQNPERSIIKDLLLNSRGFGVVQNPDGENGENLYTCKMCNVAFRDIDSLKYHMICYCQGSGSSLNSPSASSSAPISPVGSPSAAAASYIRSRSVSSLKNLARSSLNPPARNPSSLSKLAKSQLTRPRAVKPENIALPGADSPSSSSSSSQATGSVGSRTGLVDTVQNPLPSPGPLLGNTRLVESGKSPRKVISGMESNEASSKRARVESSSAEVVTSGGSASSTVANEQSSGIQVEMAEQAPGEDVKMYNATPDVEEDESRQRDLNFRRTLEISKATESSAAAQRPSAILNVIQKPAVAPPTHFHFPPINSITVYNPLTLPAAPAPGQASQIVHGGKLIPFVQGMPGPNTLSSVGPPMELLPTRTSASNNTQSLLTIVVPGTTGCNVDPAGGLFKSHQTAGSSLLATVGSRGTSELPLATGSVALEQPKKSVTPKNGLTRTEIWSPAKQQSLDFSSPSPPAPKKSFNFTRMADNVSPRKKENVPPAKTDQEVRHFHFETVIAKSDIMIKPPPPPPPPPSAPTSSQDAGGSSSVSTDASAAPSKPNRFLRPNTLPLKPGTFTPKRHHGITPTNNTMPLISPETPRPSKSCRELYFNGHAYTNIGLKSSTKPFYCTVNKTQPFYVQTQKQLSMYSNWQVHPENNPHPLGLKQIAVLSLYDSNQQRDRRFSIAGPKVVPLAITDSASSRTGSQLSTVSSGESKVRVSPVEVKSNVPCPPAYVLAALASQQPSNPIPSVVAVTPTVVPFDHQRRSPSPYGDRSKHSDTLLGGETSGLSLSRQPSRSASAERALSGGFESTEEYTYVRGRGRGKYVCNECGIRCKKPSMLKKHIRTHTDVRPYSCQYCSFHFKTKGNLTKHMKSKSHYKKCTELGLNPVPVHVDDDGADIDIEGDQQSVSSERTSTIPGDSDTATDTDGDDSDDSDDMKSRLPEHEAAEGLLSLSMTRPTSACSSLGTGHQPGALGVGGEPEAVAAYLSQHINSYLTSDQHMHQQSQHRTHLIGYSSPKTRSQSPAVGSDSKVDPPRRIITYGGGPKLELNLLKHEQYYSDPNVGKRRRDCDRSFPSASDEAAAQAGDADDEDDTARPIDLTKKSRPQMSHPNAGIQHHFDRAPQQPLAMVTPPQPLGEIHHLRYDRDQPEVVFEDRNLANLQQQQQVIVRVSDVLTPITGAANLLTTLVSNTDKIPLMMGPFEPTGGATPGGAGVDENAYFHEYLKERALQDTRIKQSQMKPSTGGIVIREQLSTSIPDCVERFTVVGPQVMIPLVKATPPPPVVPTSVVGATIPANCVTTTITVSSAVTPIPSTERVYRIFSGKNDRPRVSPYGGAAVSESKSPTVAVELENPKPESVPQSIATSRLLVSECPVVSENASPMDTLAEIAAGSLKLDVSRVQPVPEPDPIATARPRCNSTNSAGAKTAVPPVPESAKSLASEYLKLAQSVTNIGGPLRKRTESESAVGGTASDQEPLLAGPDGVQPTVSTGPPLASQQQQPQPQQQQSSSVTGNVLVPVAPPGTATATSQGDLPGVSGIVPPARKVVVVGEEGFKTSGVRGSGSEFVATPPSAFTSMHQEDGRRPVCEICNKKFHKLSQLSIHMNIHYMERKYRCEPCGTSFRSQGLYLKHERSATHRNKVSMTTTFGVATDSNPRPFYCRDCEVGFRIHGHLAKHLRSKMHVLKLECLGKLPFGTYTEIERSGTNLTEIDTSDCENSLSSLKRLATRLNVKDPAKVLPAGAGGGSSGSSSSSSTSSSSSGGVGPAEGTSGNETDSCEDNEEESSPATGLVNGTSVEADREDEQRNINNNVKRKPDESANESSSTEVKRPRYGPEMEGGLHQHPVMAATSNHTLSVEGAASSN